jgi:hypothetical protein
MTPGSSAIVTVAFGHSTEHLDHTFTSFSDKNPNIPLHAFIIGQKLPGRRLPQITYHLVAPVPDFSHPLREVYFRRHELIDQLDVEFALVVDSYDVLCLQPLLPFEKILAGFDVAAVTEHMGSRYILGQGYTANFLNGGVFFWNVPRSRDIREEIVGRGRKHFRKVADDQYVLNEVIQTQHYDRLRILPCQYNYRGYFDRREKGWPTVGSLDGVLVYHNGPSIDQMKKTGRMPTVRPRASLPSLPLDNGPLDEAKQFDRSFHELRSRHVINESHWWRMRVTLLRWLASAIESKWLRFVRAPVLAFLRKRWRRQIGC